MKLRWLLPLLIFISSDAVAEDKSISLATLEWRPYVGQDLPDGGFTTRIVREAFERAGFGVEIHFMPWARVLRGVEGGQYDAAYPAYYSDERAVKYAVSMPFADSVVGFVRRTDQSIKYTNLEDLSPYKIGVVLGYVNAPAFDAARYLDKQVAGSDLQNLLKLTKNRLDLVVIDKLVALDLIATHLPAFSDRLQFLAPPLQTLSLHVMFSRRAPDPEGRLQAFNNGLQQMFHDGTVTAILEQYGLAE